MWNIFLALSLQKKLVMKNKKKYGTISKETKQKSQIQVKKKQKNM